VWLSDCAKHGFSAGELPCGTCAGLQRGLGPSHAAVVEACLSCCSPALDYAGKKFGGAVLRVCRASASGGVQEWLEKRAGAWEGRVAVEDTCGGLPGGMNFGGMGMGAMFGGMGGFPGTSEPPKLVLLSDAVGVAAAPPPPPPPPPKGGKNQPPAKRKAAPAKEPPADAAGKSGVEVAVSSFKVDHIDAFLEKHLAAAEK